MIWLKALALLLCCVVLALALCVMAVGCSPVGIEGHACDGCGCDVMKLDLLWELEKAKTGYGDDELTNYIIGKSE